MSTSTFEYEYIWTHLCFTHCMSKQPQPPPHHNNNNHISNDNNNNNNNDDDDSSNDDDDGDANNANKNMLTGSMLFMLLGSEC